MRLYILVIISSLIGCHSEDINPNDVLILGHGGLGFDNLSGQFAPNSVPSISKALDYYDLDGVEVDIQFTRDGELMVYHDTYLENSTQCKGRVNWLLMEEISTCYYRKQFSNEYNHGIITLDSLIYCINTQWSDKYFSFNVKDNFDVPYRMDSLGGLLHEKLQKLNSLDKISVECNDANLLYALNRRNKYNCFLISDMDSIGVGDVMRFKLKGIVTRFDKTNERRIQQLVDSSKQIMLYGFKKTSDYRKIDFEYVNAIQTDNPIFSLNYFRNSR